MVRPGPAYHRVTPPFRRRLPEEDLIIVIIGIEEGPIVPGDPAPVRHGCPRDRERQAVVISVSGGCL